VLDDYAFVAPWPEREVEGKAFEGIIADLLSCQYRNLARVR
jgi:hypothetical protein